MKRKIPRILLLVLAVFAAIIIYKTLLPRHYNVLPAEGRPSAGYWNLSTGSKIAYTFIPGKGSLKPSPVIYLHGGPGGPIFNRNISALSALADDGYNVYLYDQIGCGYSDRLSNISDYTALRHKQDLEAIIKTIGAEKVILVGQSWGSILATLYIADHPDKVEKVIFTGPGPIQPPDYKVEKIKPPDSLNLRKPLTTNRIEREKVYNLRAKVVEFCALEFNKKLAGDEEMDAFCTLLTTRMSKSTVSDTSIALKDEGRSGYYCMIKTVQSFSQLKDIRPQLSEVSAPVLILRGQYDGIPWGYANEYLQIFPNITLKIIPHSGHSILLEQPEDYIREIREFLK
ncbi:MAG: alpha/beta fold hydrolase [Chloroflexota bacterium]